jgi:hypothetical protein
MLTRGSFCRFTDQDLLELFFQQFAHQMVFRGGAEAMTSHADDTLNSVTIFFVSSEGEGEPPMLLELSFVAEGGGDAGRVQGRLMDVTPEKVMDYLEETAQTLSMAQERNDAGQD